MYRVLETFDDLMDTTPTKGGTIYHRYEKGDLYPRPGATPSIARVMELSSDQNLRGKPLIAPVVANTEPKKGEVEEMPAPEKKRPRKGRRRANEHTE